MVDTMTDLRDAAIDESADAEHAATSIRRMAKLSAELAITRKQLAYTSRELARTEEQVNMFAAMDRTVTVPTVVADPGKARQAACVLLCSDWHIGERVDRAAVSGRNEYNPAIAQKRLGKLIEGYLWMIEAWRAGRTGYGWSIDTAVVWLGGDIITGMIHEDLAETNYLSPTQEVLLAQEMCTKLLDSVAAHPGIKRVLVPTSFGNHGRDTLDRRVSSSWSRSYEWMLYKMLQKQYAGGKVQVQVTQDEVSRMDVLGTKLRFSHGDAMKYGGGIGGMTIPARKWLAKLDGTEKADVTNIGHFHQYVDLGDFVVNNCLIGFSPYAQRVASYTPASQVCYLIDAKYGKRMSTEIIVQ